MDFYPDPHLLIEQELEEELSDMDFRDIVRLVQFMRNERDGLNSKIKAFLEAFEAETVIGEGITIAADFDNYWWPCTFHPKEKPDGMMQRYQALMALWEAVNQAK